MTRVVAVARRVALGLGLALSIGACAERGDTLRIGLTAFPTYEYVYLAQEQGFFAAAGLDVRVIEFTSLTDARRAYERGQVDIMPATLVEALAIRDHSTRSPQVVRVLDYSSGADVVLAQPWVTTAQSLRGARIGVELAAVPHYVLVRGLEHLGLSLDDVRLLSHDHATMDAAFRRGELEALVTYPPASVVLQRDLKVQTLFSSASIPREVFDVLLVDERLMGVRWRDVQALLGAIDRAMASAATSPGPAHAIMAERQGVSVDEFTASLTHGLTVLSPADQEVIFRPGGPLEMAAARVDRILRDAGQVTGPDRLSGLINRRFVGAR